MKRTTAVFPCVFCALLSTVFARPVSAAPLPPELNFVPPDAAFFVSVRVQDVWNDARLKPLKELLANELPMGGLEAKLGFQIEDLERITVFQRVIDQRRHMRPYAISPGGMANVKQLDPSEPVVVVTFQKPYEFKKIAAAWQAMTPAEFKRYVDEQRKMNAPLIMKGMPLKIAEPKFKSDAPPPPIKVPSPSKPKDQDSEIESKKELAPPPKGSNFSEVAFLDDKKDAPPNGESEEAYYRRRDGTFIIPLDDRNLLIGEGPTFVNYAGAVVSLRKSFNEKQKPGPLTPILENATGKHAVVAGFNLPILKKAIPADEPIADILPIASILESRTIDVTVDLLEDVKISVKIDSDDEATAKRVFDVLKASHVFAREMMPGLKKAMMNMKIRSDSEVVVLVFLPKLWQFGDQLLRSAAFEQAGASTTLTMSANFDLGSSKTLIETIEKYRNAAERANALNNFKQIGLATNMYSNDLNCLPFYPPGMPKKGKDGVKIKPNLSWRVTLLPYIEQSNLYNQFRQDEPWDSEHNKKLIPLMPKVYAPPRGVQVPAGYTFVRTFTGPNTVGDDERQVSIPGIADGSSNTIIVADAADAVPWTKPEEMEYDSKKPLPKLGGHYKGQVIVGFADGSVRILPLAKLSEKTLRCMIETNDGTPYTLP